MLTHMLKWTAREYMRRNKAKTWKIQSTDFAEMFSCGGCWEPKTKGGNYGRISAGVDDMW